MADRRSTAAFLIYLVLVAGAVLAVYGRTIDSPFIFDDQLSIHANPSIITLWPLAGDFEHPGPLNPPKDLPTTGRPLVNFSFALNYHFGQFNPAGYRVFNLIVHILSACLLLAIVRRTLRLDCFEKKFDRISGPLAFVVALLWAVHPLQTETVVYITQRTELLVGFFYLATLYGSLRYWGAASPTGRTTWLVLTTATCLAGMACKEVMVTAPVIVLLFERTFIAGSFRQALRKSWPLYVGLALGWGLLLFLNLHAPRSYTAGFQSGIAPTAWWLTQAKVLWLYLKLTVWPSPLAIHYELPYLTMLAAAWPWLLSAALLGIATVALLWRRNPIGFVGAWVLLILSPTLVVPIVTEVAAERRMYLPLAALAAFAVVGGYWIACLACKSQSDERRPGIIAIGTALLLAVLFSLISARRLTAYQSEITLWQDLVENDPNDPTAQNNLAAALNNAGRFPEAIAHGEQALRSFPNYAAAHVNLAIALASIGRIPEAIEHFQTAVRLRPTNIPTYQNLATAYAQMNRTAEAIATAQTALELARSTGQLELAQQIEMWIRSIRAGQSSGQKPP